MSLIVRLTSIFAILADAIQPPTPASGNIIAEGRNFSCETLWITLFPGVAIAMTMLGLNPLGGSVKDALDPRIRVRQGLNSDN